jgi:hypothetical protein
VNKSEPHRSHRRWSRFLAHCRALRDDSASAPVELALIVSLLGTPLLLGTGQIGFLVYDSIEISDAAHAATSYGMQSLTFASNTSGMTTAAQADAPDFGTKLTVTPITYYVCSTAIGGTQYSGTNAQSNANAACTGGTNHPLEFVQVNTSAAVTPIFHCPGVPATFTLAGSSIMEVEQ